MLACVMSARIAKGTSKKTNKDYEAIVTHVVFFGEKESDQKECEAVWIDPSLLNGILPEYGDVLDLQYNRQGFLSSARILTDKKCDLIIVDN